MSRGPIVLTVPTSEAMVELGRRIGSLLRAGDLVILDGQLGAGKTTFSRGVGDALGIRGPVTSPTFVISRVHPSLVGGPAMVHVDAYRLAALDDIDTLDLDESLEEAVTIVEWGTDRVERIADSWLTVHLERSAGLDSADSNYSDDRRDEIREVRITAHGPAWVSRAQSLNALSQR